MPARSAAAAPSRRSTRSPRQTAPRASSTTGDASRTPSADGDELAFLRIRYKLPGAAESRLIEQPVLASARTTFAAAPADARFATAVAAFGQLLRNDPNVGGMTLADVQRIAQAARGEDEFGYRSEFLRLVQVAQSASALEALN